MLNRVTLGTVQLSGIRAVQPWNDLGLPPEIDSTDIDPIHPCRW